MRFFSNHNNTLIIKRLTQQALLKASNSLSSCCF
nr:MAG TPA: hypothetical protein [Caudoviricetes sp.]